MPSLLAGFDYGRMTFSLRVAIGCCLALVIAWALGLEHPQWAGMSVWAASQPLRGQLLEKSLFRVLGTVCGTFVGVALVYLGQIHPLLLVVGLALWIGACTWTSNLQRGLSAYGVALAGYSAAMVSLLDTAHPEHVWLLGVDRMATVLTGVVVATAVGYCYSRTAGHKSLRDQAFSLLADVLRAVASPASQAQTGALFGRLAALEEALEPHGAGSLRSRRKVRAMRRLVLTMVPLLLRVEDRDYLSKDTLLAAASALDERDAEGARELLSSAAEEQVRDGTFLRLVAALGDLKGVLADPVEAPPSITLPLRLHRDWIGARQAAVRAGGTLIAVGGLWVVSGWSPGSYMLLGLSVMLSIFSSFENPSFMMRHVAAGQIAAGVAVVLCHQLLWPFAQSELQQILMMFPFILTGVLFNGHSRTLLGAMDFHLVFLLLSQPVLPFEADLSQSVFLAAAVVSAPLLAWGIYAAIYPVNAARRQQHVLSMMLHDVVGVAEDQRGPSHRIHWEMRFFHRALRLARLSRGQPDGDVTAVEASRAILVLSEAAEQWREVTRNPKIPRKDRRVCEQALRRVAQAQNDRMAASNSLLRLSAFVQDDLRSPLIKTAAALQTLDARCR